MTSLAELYKAIKIARKRPKGISVSSDMYVALRKAGVLEMKAGYGWGLFSTSEKFPVFQGDIFILINPALDGETKKFLLPVGLEEGRTGAQERRRAADRRRSPRRGSEKGDKDR
jgi:hypothetical protein